MWTSDPSHGFKNLHDLHGIITVSLSALQGSFVHAELPFPSLAQSYKTGTSEEHLATDDVARHAVLRIVAACEQMIAMVRTPMETLCDAALAYNLPACLSVLEGAHIVEILRDAGPQGMHVHDIVAKIPCEIDPMVLGRVLRFLATFHMLTEVTPECFANNRISSFMDTNKGVDAIRRDPQTKYDGTNGVSAFVGTCTHDMFKSSAYFSDSLGLSLQPCQTTFGSYPSVSPPASRIDKAVHPVWQHASNPQVPVNADLKTYHWQPHVHARTAYPKTQNIAEHDRALQYASTRSRFPRPSYRYGSQQCPSITGNTKPLTAFNLAFQTDKAYFAWLEEPEQGELLRRFSSAMRGTAEWEMGGVVKGYDWAALPEGSVVVDVGGGVGSACMALWSAYPHLRFIIQDRAPVVHLALKAWEDKFPASLSSAAVQIEEHDFFKPQRPCIQPAVYLLRAICHDWPDSQVVQILSQLRAASSPDTTLVIGDHVMPFACVDDQTYDGIPGAFTQLTEPTAESVLLANLGRANANAYWLDVSMQAIFGSQERTLKHLLRLTRSAGWTVARVNRVGFSLFSYVICRPAEMENEGR